MSTPRLARYTRSPIAIALALTLAACGGDSPSAPASGAVRFTRDANTCTGQALAFTFFVDGSSVGTETLSPGQSSHPYTTPAGTHVFSASVTNAAYTFSNETGNVTAGGTFSYVMVCQ